MIFLILMIAII